MKNCSLEFRTDKKRLFKFFSKLKILKCCEILACVGMKRETGTIKKSICDFALKRARKQQQQQKRIAENHDEKNSQHVRSHLSLVRTNKKNEHKIWHTLIKFMNKYTYFTIDDFNASQSLFFSFSSTFVSE